MAESHSNHNIHEVVETPEYGSRNKLPEEIDGVTVLHASQAVLRLRNDGSVFQYPSERPPVSDEEINSILKESRLSYLGLHSGRGAFINPPL
jgi:hypothetical protein